METILVAGANGKTGREIITLLKDMPNYTPLAMIRQKDQQAFFDKMEVDTILANLEDDLHEAVSGIDRVIFAAGSGSKTPPEKTIDVDQNGAIHLIDAAKAAGVKKFIMLSSMGADDPSKGGTSMQHYLEAKKNADDHLKAASLVYTIVRPGHLTEDERTNKIKAVENGNEHGKISRKDVAAVLVKSLPSDKVLNKTFEVIEGETEIDTALSELSN